MKIDSEIRHCALDGCGREFAPIRDNQRYCRVEHKWLAGYRRARDRKRAAGHIDPYEAKRKRLKAAKRLYARTSAGLTDRELAEALGVSRVTGFRIRRTIQPAEISPGRYALPGKAIAP